MEWTRSIMIKDREQAGNQLSLRLNEYEHSHAVVVGIPYGGVCVASAIANNLGLDLEVMPCRKIKHPTERAKYIGSVCQNEACVHTYPNLVPQDYIYHQVALLRHAIQHSYDYYYGGVKPASLKYKTVILVDDVLQSSDTVLACLRGLRKQDPLKIVVAIPVVGAEPARAIRAESDEFIFLQMEPSPRPATEYFTDFRKIDDEKIRSMLRQRKNSFQPT